MKPSERINQIWSTGPDVIGLATAIMRYLDEQHSQEQSATDGREGEIDQEAWEEQAEALLSAARELLAGDRRAIEAWLREYDTRNEPPAPPAPTPTDEPGKAGGAKCSCVWSATGEGPWATAGDPCPMHNYPKSQPEGTGAEGEDARIWEAIAHANEETDQPLYACTSWEKMSESSRAFWRSAYRFAESRGAERVTAAWKNDMAQIDALLKARRFLVEDDDTRWRLVKQALGELESKLAAAEKERDEARSEREGLSLDMARQESLAHGYTDEIAQLHGERDALSRKVEAALVELRGVQEAIKPDTVSTYEAGGMLSAAVDNVVATLEADFLPGEGTKGEAR